MARRVDGGGECAGLGCLARPDMAAQRPVAATFGAMNAPSNTPDENPVLGTPLAGTAALITGGGHHLRRGPDFEPAARAFFGDDAVEGRPELT